MEAFVTSSVRHPFIFLIPLFFFFVACKKKKEELVLPSNFEMYYGSGGNEVGWELIEFNGFFYGIGTAETESNKKDVYFLKLNACGDLLFEKHLGGVENEEGYALQATSDGNILLIGSSESASNGSSDVLIMKVSPDGEIIWSKKYGGAGQDWGVDAIETKSSLYCILANTKSKGAGDSDIWLLWLDVHGNKSLEKTFGATEMDGGSQLLEVERGEILVYGYTRNYGAVDRDLYLLKINAGGDSLWSEKYGGDGYEESQSLVLTPENDLVLIGHSSSKDPNHNMIAIKIDAEGRVIWEKEYGGMLHDGGQAILINSNRNYVLVARSMSYGNQDRNAYVVTTDTEGRILSEWIIDRGKNDRIDDIIEYQGSYFLFGRSNSNGNDADDVFLVKRKI